MCYSLWKINKLNFDNIFIGENSSLITESRIGDTICYEVSSLRISGKYNGLIKSIFYDFDYFSWIFIDNINVSRFHVSRTQYLEKIVSHKNTSVVKICNSIHDSTASINIGTSYRSLLINYINSSEDKISNSNYENPFSQFIKAIKTLCPLLHINDSTSIESVEESNKTVYVQTRGRATRTNRHNALANELQKNIKFSFMSEESNSDLGCILANNFKMLIKKIIGTEDVYIRYDDRKEAIFNNALCRFIKKSYTIDGLVTARKYNDIPLFSINTRNHTGNYIIRPFKMIHMIQLLAYTFQYSKDECGNRIIQGFELSPNVECLDDLYKKIVYGLV